VTRYLLVMVVLCLCVLEAFESMAEEYMIKPVGKVVKTDGKTVLEILPDYQDALLGLDGFSHVIVLYWFDRNDNPKKRSILRVHPRRDKRNPLRGVFATRSPMRPNLIGLYVCRIQSVDQGNIVVDKIDAFNGTPIIDLKPFIQDNDCVPSAEMPDWVTRYPKQPSD
jgi:tRNA-Thr(GGU) m(6)t(6)A37 methyltransferase TsaA